MKKFLLFLLSLFIGLVLFIWIGKSVGWQEIKGAILSFSGQQGIIILALTIIIALLGNWKWKEILKSGGVKISFKSLLSPFLAGYAVMFLAPILLWGGEIFRSYVLKQRNMVPWPKGMASVVIDRILEWTANLLVIFIGTILFFLKIGLPPIKLMVVFGIALFILTAGIIFFYFKSIKKESMVRFFIGGNKNTPFGVEKEIFNFFKIKKIEMWKVFGITLLRTAVMYLRAWVLIIFLGKKIGFVTAVAILGFTYLAVLIPIPTSLGSHEVIQIFAFDSLGLGVSTATAFTMIIRGAELIIALTGVVILFRLGLILLKNIFFKKVNGIAKNNTV